MSPEQEIVRAGKAREVLENELFKEAVEAIEQALLLAIRNSAFKDKELREKLCDRYSSLHDIIGQLKTHIETGVLAEEEIRRRSVSERIKEFIN